MNTAKAKLILGSMLKRELPELQSSVHCYQTKRNPPFDVWYSKYSQSIAASVYGNCDESHFPEIIATCKSKVAESKKEQAIYSDFSLPTTGITFNRSGDLFDGIEISESEIPFLIAMQSGDYVAWQVYADWLEEAGHTMQSLYIRHYINLHLRRIQS